MGSWSGRLSCLSRVSAQREVLVAGSRDVVLLVVGSIEVEVLAVASGGVKVLVAGFK